MSRIAIADMLTRLFCKHPHVHFDDKETLICSMCGMTWPISPAFTRASGVFLRIEQRIEDEREYNTLVKQAEAYQTDKEFAR